MAALLLPLEEDHKLLGLHLAGALEAPAHGKRLSRVRYDTDKMATAEGRQILQSCFGAFPHPGWQVPPDRHCKAIEDHARATLDKAFTLPPRRYHASYIPEFVWAKRDSKLRLKLRTRSRARLWQDLVSRAFLQWRDDLDYGVASLVNKQGLLYGLAASAIKLVTSSIKSDISLAKNDFLRKVAREGHQGAAQVLQRVKRAGFGGARARPVGSPLPVLMHPDTGAVASDRRQRDQIWLVHFGKQEQGEVLPRSEYLCASSHCRYDDSLEWTHEILPSYDDITQVIRSLPRGKAAVLDSVPADLRFTCRMREDVVSADHQVNAPTAPTSTVARRHTL